MDVDGFLNFACGISFFEISNDVFTRHHHMDLVAVLVR
jgi:hypothetical protein